MSKGIGELVKASSNSNLCPRDKATEPQGIVVENALRFRIRIQQHLKTPVEAKTVHDISANASAHRGVRFEQANRLAHRLEPVRTGQARKPAPDNRNIHLFHRAYRGDRVAVFQGICLLVVLALATGCPAQPSAAPEAPQGQGPATPSDDRGGLTVHLGGEAVERTATSANARAPWVIALHGRGSTGERFLNHLSAYPGTIRWAAFDGPIAEGDGHAWFTFRGKSRRELVSEMRRRAREVVDGFARLERQRGGSGKPTVIGFSQGAMVAWIIALEHPHAIAKAVIVSGTLFDDFVPSALPASSMPDIAVLHGMTDPVIPATAGLRNVDRLRALGIPVTVQTFDDVPHWIMGDLRTALFQQLP